MTKTILRQSITIIIACILIYCFICDVVEGAGLWSQVDPELNVSQPTDSVITTSSVSIQVKPMILILYKRDYLCEVLAVVGTQ